MKLRKKGTNTMKNVKSRRLCIFFKLASIALVICMLLGAMPIFAEETEAPATEEDKPAEVTIVVAAKKIPVGTYITADYLKTVTVPNYNIPANTVSSIEEVSTKYAVIDIYPDEYLSEDFVSSKRVNKVDNDSLLQEVGTSDSDYLVVTDYILPNTGKDVGALLQKLIDENRKRTIYFPDGEYVIGAPLITESVARNSVTLQLADGAVIKASSKWKSANGSNFLISSGGKAIDNDIDTIGSYFGVMGGTLDGNGKADGIEVVSGRETLFRNICIRNVDRGIYIQRGHNGGSSDDDFEDISIYGTGRSGSTGMIIVGHDNTFTNIRIYGMHIGVDSRGGSSLFKNISVYGTISADDTLYPTTIGIKATSWAWISQCYVENCATAYSFADKRVILSDSIGKWTSEEFKIQTMLGVGEGNMAMGGLRAEFCGESATCLFMKTDNFGSKKVIEGCSFDLSLEDSNEAYANNLITPIIPLK